MRFRFYLLIFILILFNLPKPLGLSNTFNSYDCSCIGLPIGESFCSGIPFFCKKLTNTSFEITSNNCKSPNCDQVEDYLSLKKEKKIEERGANFILVIDTSLSMKGEKIEETKEAAKKFISYSSYNDQIAIISFNTEAKLIHKFTKDKEALFDSLDKIKVSEDTRYLPALELSLKQFEELNQPNKDNVIIFLSDGQPLDLKSDIRDVVKKIKKAGIRLYTVWFGEEGEKVDSFLKEISSSLIGSNIKAFFTTQNKVSLYDSFKKIYHNIIEKDYLFSVVSSDNLTTYHMGDEILVEFQLLSKDKKTIIPTTFFDKDAFCIDKARIDVLVFDGFNVLTKVPVVFKDGIYSAALKDLPSGEYSIHLNISLDYGNCSTKDYQIFKEIKILENPRYPVLTGDSLEEVLKNISLESNTANTKEIIFLIDVSESMSNNLKEIKQILPSVIDIYSHSFDISIMAFSDHRKLISSFTSDKELLYSSISKIRSGGPTSISSSLEGIEDSFRNQYENYIILITDGLNWDNTSLKLPIGAETFIVKLSESSDKLFENEFKSSFKSSIPELKKVLTNIYYKTFNEDLIIDVSINNQILKDKNPLLLKYQLYSAYNGLKIPSIVSYKNITYLLPSPKVSLEYTSKDTNKEIELERNSLLLPVSEYGFYDLNITANYLGTNLTGSTNFSIYYPEKNKDNIYPFFIINIFLIFFMGKEILRLQ